MPIGPGKYDAAATLARHAVGIADENPSGAVVLIVLNGREGHGFSVQADPATYLRLPRLLRSVADQIEQSLRAGQL